MAHFGKTLADQLEGIFPSRGRQFPVLANQRLGESLGAVRKIESVAPLDAQEVVIYSALVAVIAAHDFHAGIGAANTERGLAAVAAMGADRSDVFHLPRARFVAVGAGRKRANRANIDTHTALFDLEVVFPVGSDDGAYA